MKQIVKVVGIRDYKDIIPVACGSEECDPSHAYGPAVRDAWVIHYVISGKGSFSTPRGKYNLGAGDIFIIRPGEVTYYEADKDDPWYYSWMIFEPHITLPSALTSEDTIYAPYLEDSFLSVVEAPDSSAGAAGFEEFFVSKIWQMIGLISYESEKIRAGAERNVRAVVNIMDAEYPRGIDVSQIAERLNLNRSYMTEMFCEVMKVSPGAYLTSVRLEKAAALLRETSLPVGVVATSVGYSDPFIFSRAFSKKYGIPPSKYKKKFARQ